jgi:hypothetical protein
MSPTTLSLKSVTEKLAGSLLRSNKWWGTGSLRQSGLAVPMLKGVYIWPLSALIISDGIVCAKRKTMSVLPTAVGPVIIRSEGFIDKFARDLVL